MPTSGSVAGLAGAAATSTALRPEPSCTSCTLARCTRPGRWPCGGHRRTAARIAPGCSTSSCCACRQCAVHAWSGRAPSSSTRRSSASWPMRSAPTSSRPRRPSKQRGRLRRRRLCAAHRQPRAGARCKSAFRRSHCERRGAWHAGRRAHQQRGRHKQHLEYGRFGGRVPRLARHRRRRAPVRGGRRHRHSARDTDKVSDTTTRSTRPRCCRWTPWSTTCCTPRTRMAAPTAFGPTLATTTTETTPQRAFNVASRHCSMPTPPVLTLTGASPQPASLRWSGSGRCQRSMSSAFRDDGPVAEQVLHDLQEAVLPTLTACEVFCADKQFHTGWSGRTDPVTPCTVPRLHWVRHRR